MKPTARGCRITGYKFVSNGFTQTTAKVMNPFESYRTPVQLFAAAYAHLMMAVLKADGKITLEENDCLMQLLKNDRQDVPNVKNRQLLSAIQDLILDSQLDPWQANHHLDYGIELLRKFASGRKRTSPHLQNLKRTAAELALVNGLTRQEKALVAALSRQADGILGMA